MAVGGTSRQAYGALLGFGEETTWGFRATATNFMEFTSQNFKKSFETEKLESLGTGRIAIRQVRKNINVDGTLSYNLHPMDGIKLLKHVLMGTVTSAQVNTSAAYNHTFTTGDMSGITQKGLNFEIRPSDDTTTAWIFTGCRVNTFKLSAAINEPVKAEVGFIGKDATTGAFATTTVTYNEAKTFLFQHATFKVDSTLENIIGFELEINNNLISDTNARSLGSQTLDVLPPARRDISLKLTQRFDTTTVWDRFKNNSTAAIQLIFDTNQTVGAGVAGQASPTTYSMYIDLKKVYYNTGGLPELSEVGILTHEVEIGVIGDTPAPNATDIIFSVTNSATSY